MTPTAHFSRARAIADETADAYSASKFLSWLAVAQFFVDLGYSDEEVVAIVRSKHMRWAADQAAGKASTRHLRAYVDSYPRFFTPAEVAELVRGTKR